MAEGILNPIPQLEADFDFDVYTKQEVDALLDTKADKVDTYTKTETDTLLSAKADADAVYTKTETDALLDGKADKSTTLAGYGITDAYTKTETDNLLSAKADASNVYTKSEIDTKIPNSVGSATKPTYVNGGVLTECTHELNKTVPANAVFTDTTYTAGNGLNLSGTSFSAKAGTNVTVDSGGINVNGNGAVASADSGLISGGTAYTELRPTLDGTWVKNAQTTATNLQKLEGGIEYLYGLLSHQYDQLKKYINGNYYDYDTDNDTKYVKTVPNGAMPYASLDSIGGKTVVWNQLLSNGNFTDSTGWTTSATVTVADNVYSFTETVSAYIGINRQSAYRIPMTLNHKYYISAVVSTSAGKAMFLPFGVTTYGYQAFLDLSGKKRLSWIYTATQTAEANMSIRFNTTTSGVSETINGTIENYFVIDLTLLYGAGNEPSTVQEFTAQFPAQYYPYNAGTLLSAGVTSVVSKKADTTEIATYPIPAEIQALEGYGWSAGSVSNYIDYERKVFVQRVGRVDLGSLAWGWQSAYGVFSSNPGAYDNTKTMINVPSGIACQNYVFMGAYFSMTDKAIGYIYNKNFAVKDDSFNGDAGAFKTAMSGIYACYPLATPQEIDISEYLTDDNLIEVEAGGSLTFPNSNGDDYRIPIPSSETYMVDLQSAI